MPALATLLVAMAAAPPAAATPPTPTRPASLALPREGRIAARALDDGSILVVEPSGRVKAPEDPAIPATLALRAERLPGERLRLVIAGRHDDCAPRLVERNVVCRRPTEVEARERVSAMVREPLDVEASDDAAAAKEAERLLAARDLDGAVAGYGGLRRAYATRGIAELRLADLMWLAGRARDAVAEWGRVAVRFRRRPEGRIAALRAAAAAWHVEGAVPASLPEPEPEGAPLAADAALARAHLLGALGRFEQALEAIREPAPDALRPSFDRLRRRLLATGLRTTSVRGEPMRTVVMFRRHFQVVRAHADRVDLELATADALLDLDLVEEAVEVVDDALAGAADDAEQARVGAWIDRVRASAVPPGRPRANPPPPHPLAARLAALGAEVDALARVAGGTP